MLGVEKANHVENYGNYITNITQKANSIMKYTSEQILEAKKEELKLEEKEENKPENSEEDSIEKATQDSIASVVKRKRKEHLSNQSRIEAFKQRLAKTKGKSLGNDIVK